MKNKTGGYIALIVCAIMLIYGIYIVILKNRLIDKKGIYTIGTVDKIKVGSKGLRVFISFYYKGNFEELDYLEYYEERDKLFIGKRIFIKFVLQNNVNYMKLSLDCIVPDSIKVAPDTGWTEEWMKKHFPYCIEAMNE